MNGTVSRVARRSLGDFRVRVAMTPGTAQPPAIPPETINAMTDAPCRPNIRNTRSSMNAIRARYPESSRKEMPRNMNKINGHKPQNPAHAVNDAGDHQGFGQVRRAKEFNPPPSQPKNPSNHSTGISL